MFHIAFTPDYSPSNALCAQHETLMGAIAELLKSIDLAYGPEEWYVEHILLACYEAVQNLELGKTAKASWTDMGCEDDAFSIDIFTHEEARYIQHDGEKWLAPHGAVGFVADPLHEQWLYDEAEIADWENVLLPHVVYMPDAPKAEQAQPPQPTIESHNEPLRAAMFARGCEWKVNNSGSEHFTKDGKYEPYPVGYICGPHHRGNVPDPYQFSVQGANGWLIRSFSNIEEGKQWALETALALAPKADETTLTHEQLKSMLANHDEFEVAIVNRKYADIRSQLAEMGYPVDIQIVMVVVDQMASSDPYFVRLAETSKA